MKDAAEHLERVQDLAEPQVESEGYDHGRDHNQTSVPTFWYVVFVVEDHKRGDDVREDGWRSATGKAPSGRGNPSCVWH
jgi:hypothetical protein